MTREVLGRGLEALIPIENVQGDEIQEIPIENIFQSPYQPRHDFDKQKLSELANSIKEMGIIQPIIVRKTDKGFEIIAGERRWQAARVLGLAKIPAIIKQVTLAEALEMALIENIQREDLNPLDEAQAYHRLISEFQLTQEQVSQKVGKDRSSVSNYLRLLKLPEEIQADLAEGGLTMGHARSLLSLQSEKEQILMRDRIIKRALSVRDTERAVQKVLSGSSKKARDKDHKDGYIVALEERLETIFSTKVRIRTSSRGGRLEIAYFSQEDFARILDLIEELAHMRSKK